MEINTSNCLKLIMAFRQNINLIDLDPSNYFLNVCVKNLEHYLNQSDTLQISSLFSSKYKEHHLLAVAMSLYLDVKRKVWLRFRPGLKVSFVLKTPFSGAESAKLENLLDEYPSLRLIIDSKTFFQPNSLYTLLQVDGRLWVCSAWLLIRYDCIE